MHGFVLGNFLMSIHKHTFTYIVLIYYFTYSEKLILILYVDFFWVGETDYT